jgi:hypothetical protein
MLHGESLEVQAAEINKNLCSFVENLTLGTNQYTLVRGTDAGYHQSCIIVGLSRTD